MSGISTYLYIGYEWDYLTLLTMCIFSFQKTQPVVAPIEL